MPDIVISEFMDQDAVDAAAADYDLLYDPKLVDRSQDLAALLSDARALVVRNRTQVNARLLEAAPILKVVGRLGVGLDNIDTKACAERGIAVCPATGANDLAVAEWVIVSAMLLFRVAFAAREQVTDGKWPRNSCMGRETAGKTLGLVGFGNIAREAARLARALGMRVIAHDPYVDAKDPAWEQAQRMASLEGLLASADAVSLHVPLTDSTRHLIGAKALAAMMPGALLLNAARGGVVDEDALVAALRSGALGGAALDVYENEPLSRGDGEHFTGLDNLILTPHIAGVSVESNKRVSKVTMENVRRVLESGK
ncbi:MAG: hydroxyacid dehydrogenase [Desulfarculaceae bacterium]|nr:hydroxyacid dehydrogenase [Desulfarculaceae bacterium]MCF8046778.1 hydroxyacid dehydrogenase [Desulfarculaceae bacterium]MCF8124556.1 hydroxyacid dehydrogenase [Desulfarculaceae bacterium]